MINKVQVENTQANGAGLKSAFLNITPTPAIAPNQKVNLMLNKITNEIPVSYVFTASSRSLVLDVLSITVKGIKPGDYLVRLDVDKAESLLLMADGHYSHPKVTI